MYSLVGEKSGLGPTIIKAGEDLEGDTTIFSCAAGGSDCTITTVRDSATDELTATATGGELTWAQKVDMSRVSADARKDTGTLEIPAGESRTFGDVTYSCAAGDTGCTVTVKADGTATSTGGTVTAADSDRYTDTVAAAAAAAARKKAADEAEAAKKAEAEKKQAAAALKLYTGISGFSAAGGAGNRSVYWTTEKPLTLRVQKGEADVDMKEDTGAASVKRHGWTRKRYTAAEAPSDGSTYTAFVYGNIGDPTPQPAGKFSDAGEWGTYFGTETPVDGKTEKVLNEQNTEGQSGVIARSANFGFAAGTNTAGVKVYPLQGKDTTVTIDGVFDGVPGEFICKPSGENVCAARLTSDEFSADKLGVMLGGAEKAGASFAQDKAKWQFRPDDPDALTTANPDRLDEGYSTYGWWIHKSRDDMTWTASAFYAVRDPGGGVVREITNLTRDSLQGKATYTGGAGGYYAINSTVAADSHSGWFEANATLEADFSANMVTGTISGFRTGTLDSATAGTSRNWSVELLKKPFVADGGFDQPIAGGGTKWTMDGTAANASGTWEGTFAEGGDTTDGLPDVAVGTFYTEYHNLGRMVGGFGVNKPPPQSR